MSVASLRFLLNDADVELGPDGPDACAGGLSLLDFLRRRRRLTGTKEGCKEGDCGACTVLVGDLSDDGRVRYGPVTSCMIPVAELDGRHLVTVEGLDVGRAGKVQRRIVDEGATQCGFCTPGIVVSLIGRLMDGDAPASDPVALPAAVDRALSGHLCRCTGYRSLRSAAESAFAELEESQGVEALVAAGELPEYFLGVPDRLRALQETASQESQKGEMETTEIRTDRPVVAGGTDLYVQRSEELPVREVTSLPAWLPSRPELRGVRRDDDGRLRIGALTTFEDLVESPEMGRVVPRIGEFMHLVASWQIRNRSTVGGNLVNASPIGDVTILLLAMGAEAVLESAAGPRTLPLRELYLGYKELAMEPGEMLTELRIDADGERDSARRDIVDFEKVSKRRTLDIASVNTAMRIRLGPDDVVERCGLAAGGVAPVPLFLQATSDAVEGRRLDRETVDLALRTVQEEISPISDVRGSVRYKRLLVRNLLVAHLAGAIGRSDDLLREAA